MFKRLISALSIAIISVVAASAQAVDDYKKGEFFVGYSNGQVDTGLDSGSSVRDFFRDRANFNGFNASGVYNVTRYVGIKGDVSGTYNNTRFDETFVDPTTGTTYTAGFDTKNSLYNFVGGVQVKDNAKEGTFKPFAHAMVGVARGRTEIRNLVCTPSTLCPILADGITNSGLSGVFGGGLDFRLNNKIQIRAIQVDYNPIRSDGETSHNMRIGAGIVF